MCEGCIDKKQPLIKGSMKSNPKRVVHDLKKLAQKKRKVNVKPVAKEKKVVKIKTEKTTILNDVDDDSSESSEDKCVYELDGDSSTETEEDESSGDDDSSIEIWNGYVSRPLAPKVTESIFKKCNELYEKYSLTRIDVPGLGDCIPQAYMVAHFNLNRKFTED